MNLVTGSGTQPCETGDQFRVYHASHSVTAVIGSFLVSIVDVWMDRSGTL